MDPLTRKLVETVRHITHSSQPVEEGVITTLAKMGTGLGVLPKAIGRGIKGGIAGGAAGAGIGGMQGWEHEDPDSWFGTSYIDRASNSITGAIGGGIGGAGVGTGLGVASTFPNKLKTAKTALNLAQTAGDKISDAGSALAVKGAERMPPVGRAAGRGVGKAVRGLRGKLPGKLGLLGLLGLGLTDEASAEDVMFGLHPLSIFGDSPAGLGSELVYDTDYTTVPYTMPPLVSDEEAAGPKLGKPSATK